MHPSSISEIYNNMGRAYGELEDHEKAETYFQKALSEDEYNVKATRNTRMLEKMKEKPNRNNQYMLAGVPLALISGSYYLLLIEKISQTVFGLQSTILIASFIAIYLYQKMNRSNELGSEFELSSSYVLVEAKNQIHENAIEF
jgi:superkiller protein 3